MSEMKKGCTKLKFVSNDLSINKSEHHREVTARAKGRRRSMESNHSRYGWRAGTGSIHGKLARPALGNRKLTRRAATGSKYRGQTPRADVERKYLGKQRAEWNASGTQVAEWNASGKATASMRARMWNRYKPALDHIEKNHMFKGKDRKSVFFSTKLCDISVLVHKTMTYPDRIGVDKSNLREVYVKSFTTPVGVHGLSRGKCYTVKVVFDQRIQKVVTAYPIYP